MLNKYFQDIFKTTKTGGAREESYYPDLKKLLESWSEKENRNFLITALPKKAEGGNPDFRILTAKKELVGYIEVKNLTVEDLDKIEDTEQLKRYRDTFPNLILTNLFEFRLYRNGILIDQVSIGRPFIIHQLKIAPPVENQDQFFKLLEKFFSFSILTTTTAKSLAIELAKRTRFLRDNVIAEELKEENIEGTQTLEGFYKAFKEHLISSLAPQDFANLFAQTITYGLFAARSRAKEDFNRELAHKYIPPTIGILKKVFQFISSSDLPKSMEWIIDDITEVLRCSDVKKIMENFYKQGKGRDPIISFYETFLAEYDPKEREKRGVYYTPEPVVSYITRSIHKLLKEKFKKEDGFATQSVTVLDPAAGTLTFPAFAINLAVSEFKNKYGEGGINSLIKDHILKNFYAFELMMAPYAVGHLKMGLILNHLNYKFSEDERFNLYLTNTLDFTKEDPNKFPGIFEQTIAKESEEALKIKEDIPIMIVMGNPPYSGSSENKGEWILKKIDDYKQIEGESLKERNPKWIQDDYVKFFRFAQWKIEQTGQGVLGFITNHAWLDNPTFRGMRYSLLKTFDEIYILNLHGSLLKKERTPEGKKDENVFDIQPGVAITICIKDKNSKKSVQYGDIWGLREEKYKWLEKHSIENTKWQEISPKDPYYFFVPKEEKGWKEYEQFWKITDIFPVNNVGVVTGRDNFVIDENRQSLETRIRNFVESKEDIEFIKSAYGLKDKPVSNWFVENAREKLRKDTNWEKCFTEILYRPFDTRWIFYHPALVERPRENVMKHMLHPNLGLISTRFVFRKEYGFQHAFVTDSILDINQLQSPGTARIFPLYLYGDKEEQGDLFEKNSKNIRSQNLAKELWDYLGPNYIGHASPEDIFNYIYAILYSNSYRQKYQEFLKTDFPRIPFTKDYKLFQRITEFGKQLIDLHLLNSPELDVPISKFYGKDNNRVDNVRYEPIKIGTGWIDRIRAGLDEREWKDCGGILFINDKQFFSGITEEMWNYYIGGYQVLQKWLKDRKGRELSSEEIKHYCKIVTAIKSTIEIQKEIDRLYPKVEKNLI